MAVVEQKTEVKTEEKDSPRYRITPRYGVWTDDDKLILQVALPGVKKDAIEMKALSDYFTLRAKRADILYALDLDFGEEIEPDKSSAKYEEGLLRIEFKKYNPLEHAYEVKIE